MKLDEFFCWVILSTCWNVLREKVQPDNQHHYMCMFSQWNLYQTRKQIKHDMEPIKLQIKCKNRGQKLALGRAPVHVLVAIRKNVLPCPLTMQDRSVLFLCLRFKPVDR